MKTDYEFGEADEVAQRIWVSKRPIINSADDAVRAVDTLMGDQGHQARMAVADALMSLANAVRGRTDFISLGTGILTWDRHERVSDRYGTVYLMADGGNSLAAGSWASLVTLDAARTGALGYLAANVIRSDKSTHIGDFYRGISPRMTPVGRTIILGYGALFTASVAAGGFAVGVSPLDGASSDWLNPRALYDVHEHFVALRFLQENEAP